MNFKKIKFIPTNELTEKVELPPSNAASMIPDWYKKTPLFVNGYKGYNDFIDLHKDAHREGTMNSVHMTLKNCQPFIDTFTAGYMIKLPATIMVYKDDYGNSIVRWSTDYEIVDSQDSLKLGNFKTPDGYNPQFFRWKNAWIVETPSGYSSLFTHPLNRFDLPFITLSAIVDTDKHPNSVIIPFFIKNDFEGMIEEGTPIAQVIPFKRDNWESSIEKSNNSAPYSESLMKTSFIKAYRKKFWSKKTYR
jgi:hypothetical protein